MLSAATPSRRRRHPPAERHPSRVGRAAALLLLLLLANFKMALVVFVIPWSAQRLILQEGILWSRCCRYKSPAPSAAARCAARRCYGTSNKWLV